MTVEVATNEVVNLFFSSSMEILELMHRLELDDVEAVGEDTIRFALEKVF